MNTIKNSGHGHVYPRADGIKLPCGGPGLCAECTQDSHHKTIEETVGTLDDLPKATPPAGVSGREAIERMTKEFLRLVVGYNELGLLRYAQHAQRVAVILDAFNRQHILKMHWPVTHTVGGIKPATMLGACGEDLEAADLVGE